MNFTLKITGITCALFFSHLCYAELNLETDKYRRSSLHTILIESDAFPQKDIIMAAYDSAPFPEKYNNHTVDVKTMNPKNYALTNAEKEMYGLSFDAKDSGNIDNLQKELPYIIEKFMNESKLGNKMVAKWFNRSANGSFDMSLIMDRGFYDATEAAANLAKSTVRGVASLGDAGEELLGNTFVVMNKMSFVDNELPALAAYEIAKALAYKIQQPIAQQAALAAAKVAYEKARQGYSLWTVSFLYQLEWTDSVAAVFYNDYWVDSTYYDASKAAAFDTSNLFRFKYIGSQKSKSLVMGSLTEQRSDADMLTIVTIRNIDKVYANLQREYDVFKTKSPLISVDPLMAKVGMKEGIEKGDRFEVLEKQLDPETGRTSYARKGIIFVDQSKIWDNRYNAGQGEDEKPQNIDATYFKGPKKLFYEGMLIRQIK